MSGTDGALVARRVGPRVVRGRQSDIAGEMALIGEATTGRDLIERKRRAPEQILRDLEAPLQEPLVGRVVADTLDHAESALPTRCASAIDAVAPEESGLTSPSTVPVHNMLRSPRALAGHGDSCGHDVISSMSRATRRRAS